MNQDDNKRGRYKQYEYYKNIPVPLSTLKYRQKRKAQMNVSDEESSIESSNENREVENTTAALQNVERQEMSLSENTSILIESENSRIPSDDSSYISSDDDVDNNEFYNEDPYDNSSEDENENDEDNTIMSKLGSLADGLLSMTGVGRPFERPMALRTSRSKATNAADCVASARLNLSQKHREMRPMSPNTEAFTSAAFPGQNVQPNPIAARDSESRENYELGAYGYGKSSVKLLHVRRENKLRHEIREYEIDVYLRLGTQKDYLHGDNRDIIATDSQKNTVYLMAKKHGVMSPEQFGILLCSHFLYQYRHVEEVSINIEEYPWARHEVNGVQHNHAFVFSPTVTRYCQVTQLRNESAKVRGGLKNFRLLKTTQSSFTDFIQDDYRTLPDADDRIFSTIVTATWEFSTISNVDFDKVWQTVKACILENFAGPPESGIYSPSVQNTLYLAEKCVLSRVKEIYAIEMKMPNKHYFDIDFSKFSKLVQSENKEVYLPVDKPSGVIYAQLHRKNLSSNL